MNCKKCGELLNENATTCHNCGYSVLEEPEVTPVIEETVVEEPSVETPVAQVPVQKPENVFTGIIGALIGAALGAGSIILLSQLGFIASISGLILAVCTLKGYELLGNRLSTTGIIVSLLLMLVTPYLADRMDWAIVIMQTYADEGVTLGEAFRAVPYMIQEGGIEQAQYIKSLLMLYGFTALGGFSTVANTFKKKK